LTFATSLCALPAQAHPHVWVTAKTVIVFGADGAVTGLRYLWTFDDAYSAFAVQGLDKNNDGKLTPDELADLAKVNVESLGEFGYFTSARASGRKLTFKDPVDYGLDMQDKLLVLHFTLPLAEPLPKPKVFSFDIYDPTYFVDFTLAKSEDAVTLASAPQGCAVNVSRPKPPDPAAQQKLSEGFFSALSANSNFGAQFSNAVIVACP
jgi:ABC-type uncharacterized transport system substrate-binding protein